MPPVKFCILQFYRICLPRSIDSVYKPYTSEGLLSPYSKAVSEWAQERGIQIPAPSPASLSSRPIPTDPNIDKSSSSTILHCRLNVTTSYWSQRSASSNFPPRHQTPKKQSSERLKILKALADTNWGQEKETIIMTYKVLIRYKFTYAATVWFLNISTSDGKMLQTVQNTAMRIATGCHQSASSDHLHAETQLLPIVKSLEMVCSHKVDCIYVCPEGYVVRNGGSE